MNQREHCVSESIGVFGIKEKEMKNIAIRENHLYSKTFTRGKKYVGRYVAVYVLRDLAAKRLRAENPLKEYVNRLGISVSKKFGTAVERNRAKRIIRAGYDAVKADIKKGNLIVVSPRMSCKKAKSTDIYADLLYAAKKLSLLAEEKPQEKT
jgi:ribonuclease P protein component